MSDLTPATADPPLDVDVAILGAGIGGLGAALALRRAGIRAHVYERALELGPVGGAVVIREPVVRLLESWGVAEKFHAEAVRISAVETLSADGKPVGAMPVDPFGEGRAYSIHRADLHALLLSGLDARDVHLGLESVAVMNDGDDGIARFKDGRHLRAKALIGADGIKSVARRAVVQDDLVFSKLVVLRGLASFSSMPWWVKPGTIYNWGLPPRMMITLPLRSGAEVAMDTAMSMDEPPEHLWTSEVPRSLLLDLFKDFDPALLTLIEAGTVPVRANPVFEREPIDIWSKGGITLLGDAAHPMAPRMGQGANQALLDCDAIVRALAETGLAEVPEAWRRYQSARAPLTKIIQIASRAPPPMTPSATAAHG